MSGGKGARGGKFSKRAVDHGVFACPAAQREGARHLLREEESRPAIANGVGSGGGEATSPPPQEQQPPQGPRASDGDVAAAVAEAVRDPARGLVGAEEQARVAAVSAERRRARRKLTSGERTALQRKRNGFVVCAAKRYLNAAVARHRAFHCRV